MKQPFFRSLPLPLVLLFFSCVLLLFPGAALASPEFDLDMRFLRELNTREFYDFAALQVDRMLQNHPENRDEILVEAARTHYASGRSALADEALAQIKPDSTAYADALLLGGEVAAARKRNQDAEKVFAEFFKRVKAPAKNDAVGVARYRRAASVYSHVLKQLGKGQEAARVIGLLGDLPGSGGASDRQMAFLKGQAVLDAEEEKLEQRNPLDRAAVAAAIEQMKQLQFHRDGVAAASFLETARAHILLGGDKVNTLMAAKKTAEVKQVRDFIEAIKVLQIAAEFLEEIEYSVVKGNDKSKSPLAGALYYKGRALRGESLVALVKENEEQARKLVEAAAHYFETVVVDYGDSPYRMKSLVEHGKCSDFMEARFGKGIELAQANLEAEIDLKIEQAAAFIQARNYAAAIPLYMTAVRVGRRSKRLPDVVKRLVVCYGHVGQFLEAETLVSYLVDVLPGDAGTAECAFRLGAVMYEKAKGLEAAPAREALLERAMTVWDAFVDTAPTHSKAPDVAFVIAEHHYRVAGERAEKAKHVADHAAREMALAEAREAYLAAVPKYLRLIDQFGGFDKGVRALYKLGWIYYSTDQSKEAIDAFLRYCDQEGDPQRSDDRLEAKFRAAEVMMRSSTPEDAVLHFEELLSWFAEGTSTRGLNLQSSAAQRIREDAMSYLGWSLDLTAERERPQMTELRRTIREQEQRSASLEKLIREQEARLAELAAEREEADRAFQDLEQQLTVIGFDYQAAAREQARIQAEKVQGMSAEERAVAERNLAADVQRLAADLEQRAAASVDGERIAREEEREQIKTAREQNARDIERLKGERDAQAKKLAEIRQQEKTIEEQRDAQVKAVAAAEKAVVEGEAESRRLSDDIEAARDAQIKAQTPEQRNAFMQKRRELSAALVECQRRLESAHATRDRVVTPASEQQLVEWQAQLATIQTAGRQQQNTINHIEQDLALAEKEADILQARLVAVTQALDFNQELGKVLQRPAGERETQVDRLKTLGRKTLDEFRKVRASQVEKNVLLQNRSRDRIAAAREGIKNAQARIAELQEMFAPVRRTFAQWKERAQGAFREFLAAYPASKHVPDNMSRLGSIYIELEQFEEATAILQQLAEKFPDSPARGLAQFNLGRAQAEVGKTTEAAAAFESLLQQAGEVPTANLGYVADTMLQAGHAAASLAASRELLQRSDNPEHPDYEALRPSGRERALFQAASAALQLQHHAVAIDYFDTLLRENPNSGYFFDAKFGLAQARSLQTPPDTAGAEADLGDILQHANRPEITHRALCMSGDALAAASDEAGVRQAVARFQQVVLLADPAVTENRPWIEQALARSAQLYARLGDTKKRDEMLARYRREFANGAYEDELKSLPAHDAATGEEGRSAPERNR